jgi:hypothetical protein
MEYDEYGFPINYNSGYGLGSTSKTNTGFDLGNLDPLTVGQPIKVDMSPFENMNKAGPRVGSPGSIKFGYDSATPNSGAFQGTYKGILSDTGEMGWSTDPAAFKAGTVEDAVWGDGKTLNAGGAMAPDDSLLGLSTGEWDNAMKAGQLGMGAGQLGLGIAGYFQNRGLADKQKQVLGQQIESNRAEIDSRKNYRNALSSFGQ